MKITDLIIDPRSLGNKLWLVEVTPAYEYGKDERRTDTITGYRYSVALPDTVTVLPVIQRCILQAICHLKSNTETCSRTAWKPGVLLSAVFIRCLNIGLTARCGKSSTKEMWENEKYRKRTP